MSNRPFVLLCALGFLVIGAIAANAHDEEEGEGKAVDPAPAGIGDTGPFPSSNRVQLLSQVTVAEMGGDPNRLNNDIWGWTDSLTGHEYALVGRYDGTSFVDVTDPYNPIVVAELNSYNDRGSYWRDIKVYDNYAYIVADPQHHGLQIFDLTKLRTTTPGTVLPSTYGDPNNPQSGDYLWHHDSFTFAHNIAINEESGFAYVTGSNIGSRGLHILDLSNPTNPTVAGEFASDGYTHDAQVVMYHGPDADYRGMEIAFNSNEDTLTIANVTNKAATVMISRNDYAPSSYTHQGWLTEDQKYFLLADETDETKTAGATLTRTHVFDVEDLDNPVYVGYHTGVAATTDHNLYIHQGLIYEANYASGLRILEPIDLAAAQLNEVGYLDTYPTGETEGYDGAWSVYPFFKSGTIIVNDRQNGLFIARLLKGDTDDDGDVDNTDMLTSIGNFTGSGGITGVHKAFAQGSFDGDGDVDNTDLLNAIGSFTGSGGSAAGNQFVLAAGSLTDHPDQANLLYDPTTGNLKIDPSEGPGGELTGYVLQSDGEFIFANHIMSLGGTAESTTDELSEANPFGSVTATTDLGNVLVAGLTLAELESLLTTANYTGMLGSGVNEFDLIVVPEPQSLALLGVGLLLLMAALLYQRRIRIGRPQSHRR